MSAPDDEGCPLCRHTELEVLGRRSDFGDIEHWRGHLRDLAPFDREIRRCLTCGLQYAWPAYGDAEFGALYTPPDYLQFLSTRMPEFSPAQVQIWREELERLRVPAHAFARSPSPSCLDLGCGFGKGMYVLRELGFAVTGIDMNAAEVEHARTHLGLDARVLPMDRVAELGRTFDCVTSSHVIEHVRDPHAFVRTASSMLAPEGVLVLETPLTTDFGDVRQRYTDVYHTLFFDHFTLGLLLQLNDFTTLHMQNISFYLPGDWSENVFMQASYVRAKEPLGQLSAAQIRAQRAAYDGLARDALRWARADLKLRLPRHAVTKQLWHELGGRRFEAVRPRKLLLAARSLRAQLSQPRRTSSS